MEYVALACRWAISGVFLAAAVSKIRSAPVREAFLSAVSALVPAVRSAPLGVFVVGVELAVAVLVALPWTTTVGLGLAVGTLIAFSIAILLGLRRGVSVACRCFGWSDAPVSQAHLVRNGALVGIALLGWVTHLAAAGAALHPGGVAVSLAATVVLIVAVTSVDDLAWLFS